MTHSSVREAMERIDSREYGEWIAEYSLMPWGLDLAAIGHKSNLPQSNAEIASVLMAAGSQNAALEAERMRRFGHNGR